MIGDWAKLIERAIITAVLIAGALVSALYLIFPAGALAVLVSA